MLLYLIALLVALPFVRSLHNITIDDASTSILYAPSPSWSPSAENALDIGSFHMLTQDPTATATFTFTGVAIYFLAPRWPYRVSTAVSLDSSPAILLDLIDHTRSDAGQGSETVQSQVIWGMSGLPNAQHSLVMSVGAGEPFAIVDALIYTVLDNVSSSATTSFTTLTTVISSKTTSTSTSPTSASTAPSNSNTAKTDSSRHVLPIALGTALGVCGIAIFALALWFCARPRERPTSESWSVPGPSYPTSPHMANTSPPLNSPFISPYPVPHYPSGGSWVSQDYTSMAPMPGAMPPATAAALARPYSHASSSSRSSTTTGTAEEPPWQGTTAQIAQRFGRAPNRLSPSVLSSYQPNTLSTITETSSPMAGSASLANSPSSFQQTELTHGDVTASPQSGARLGLSGYSPKIGGNQRPMPTNASRPHHPPAYSS